MSRIEFHDTGPFDLPAAQSSHAASSNGSITITFRVLVSTNREEVVRIAVSNNQALELASQIASSAAKANTQTD